MQELLTFEFTCDTASFELFDKECLRLRVTLHMQDEMPNHHLMMHAGRLTISNLPKTRTSPEPERPDSVMPMWIGAAKGKGARSAGTSWAKAGREEGQMVLLLPAEGHIEGDCKNRQRDLEKAKEVGKPFVDREAGGSDHG